VLQGQGQHHGHKTAVLSPQRLIGLEVKIIGLGLTATGLGLECSGLTSCM